MAVILFLPLIESRKEVGVIDTRIGEECERKMRETSSSGVERDMLLKRTIARKMGWFLDAAKTTKILRAVGLLVP